MVDPSRIKLVLTRDGDNVITDLQEAVDKESGVRQAYVMTIPYKVVITEEPQQQTDLETFEDQEIKVRYTPWNPFTIDQKIAVTLTISLLSWNLLLLSSRPIWQT